MGADRSPGAHWSQNTDWMLMLPPGRPSTYHLGLFAKHLCELSRAAPIAILGSTPELRDLCVELGFTDVWSIDKSLSFHQQVDALRVHVNHEETVVVADWLDILPTLPGHFAAILSDLTLGNIAYSDRERFFAAIADSLLGGGLFIDKVLTNEAPVHRLDDLDARYRVLPLNLGTINRFSSEYFFCSELVERHGVVDVALFRDLLTERLQHPRLRAFLAHSLRLTTPVGVWHYGRPWDLILPTYATDLHTVASYPEERGSPYEGRLRIIVSIKAETSGG
jgi:hypothetical protein